MPEIVSDLWQLSNRADPRARALADRHYNRQKIGAKQFVPPGRCLVLYRKTRRGGEAFWITSFPFAQYVKHAWAGAMVCSAFRNEGAGLSSVLIEEAVRLSFHYWEPPALGMVTFVNTKKTRTKDHPGRCYREAGFHHVGETKAGLVALQRLADPLLNAVLGLERACDTLAEVLHGR